MTTVVDLIVPAALAFAAIAVVIGVAALALRLLGCVLPRDDDRIDPDDRSW